MNSPHWSPRVIVSAIIERDGRFLMVEEHTSSGLRLNPPGGHLEPGESPQQAIVREVLEETRRMFTPEAFLGAYLAPAPKPGEPLRAWLRLTFCGQAGQIQPHLQTDEGIVRNLWMTPDEIRSSHLRHRNALIGRSIQDYQQGCRYPLGAIYTQMQAHWNLQTKNMPATGDPHEKHPEPEPP